MRAQFIPLLVMVSVLITAEVLLGKKNEMPTALSVRQQVDSEVFNLEKNLKAAKSSEARWKFLESSKELIKALRSKSSRQFEQDEIYMDYIYFSLRDFPSKAEFKSEKCGQYRSSIIANYNPQFETAPDPAIAKTLGLLGIICK